MPDLDEEKYLELEQRQHDLDREIEDKRNEARRLSGRLLEARGELERIQRSLEDVEGRIRRMRNEYPIVLLSEFRSCLVRRERDAGLLAERQEEVNRLDSNGRRISKQIPQLVAQLKQVEAQLMAMDAVLAGYGKVLEFHR